MKNILLVSLVLTFLASCTTNLPKSPTSIAPTSPTQEEKMIKEDSMTQSETTVKEATMMTDEAPMTKSTGYMTYDSAKLESALTSGKKVALFFHATWCPSCKALDKSITANTVPGDAIIFKVDFDSSDALKKQYRVVWQHTTVILNADGTEKSKKLGARTIAEIFN